MENEIEKYKSTLKKALRKINELDEQLKINSKKEDIAIIGCHCCFPGGADSAELFWERLAEGYDAVTEIKKDRFDIDQYYSEIKQTRGKTYTRYGSFIEADVKSFDNIHFEISAIEAISIDPQQRFILEMSWDALEKAGLNIEKLRGSKTGVFIGSDSFEYVGAEMVTLSPATITPYSLMGVSRHAMPGRVSYFYDFKGPAIMCDTACSSSLSALCLAVESLKKHECDMALVGGINLMTGPEAYIGLSQFNGLSADGRCKTFDEAADGFGRGEGCAFIILKRLEDAVKDNNTIEAIIKGSSMGHDGRTNGFYAPNGAAEQHVIEAALKEADVSVDDIDYIEAHGAGTVLGDLIECQALCGAFKRRSKPLLIGSVKSNIGHLAAAAGIAGLIKVLLAMRHGQLPPTINLKNPNKNIDWNKLEAVTELRDWNKEKGKRLAGINSFGISGTLVHVILQDYAPEKKAEEAALEALPVSMVTLSAKNQQSLQESLSAMLNYIQNSDLRLEDIAYSTIKTRSSHDYRFAVIGENKDEITRAIQQAIDNEQIYESSTGYVKNTKNKVVFLFAGQGSIYGGIAKELYDHSIVFRTALEECEALFSKYLKISIKDSIFHGDEATLRKPFYSQPIIFSVEYALVKQWESMGIKPDLVIGHSVGEYAAACTAGLFSLDCAAKMISIRSELMEAIDLEGKMIGIVADAASVGMAIDESNCTSVEIAAINSPLNVTISGLCDEVDEVVKHLHARKRVFINDLHINRPYHNKIIAKYEKEFAKELSSIEFKDYKLPMISSVTGKVCSRESAGNAGYWASHLSKKIDFMSAILSAENAGANVYLEIGGTATLCGLASQCVKPDDKAVYLPSLRHGVGEYQQLMNSLRSLYLRGLEINFHEFFSNYNVHQVNIPGYSFCRKVFWKETKRLVTNDVSYALDMENRTVKKEDENSQSDISRSREKNVKEIYGVSEIIIDRKKKVLDDLKGMIQLAAGLEFNEIKDDAELFEFGLDSLIMMSLSKQITTKYRIEIAIDQLFTSLNTLEKLAAYISDNSPVIPENIIEDDASLVELTNEQLPEKDHKGRDYLVTNGASNFDTLKEIFNQQFEIMKKQNELLESLTFDIRKTSGTSTPISLMAERVINKNNTVKTFSILESPPAVTTDYYIPYHKADLTVSTPMQKLMEEYIKKIEQKYTSLTKKSKELTAKYKQVHASARNSAGFTLQLKEMIYLLVAEKGIGSKIYDVDGNEFIDITMGFGVNLFGHAPEFITEALRQEIDTGFPLGPMNLLAGEVARQIAQLTQTERVFFCNTGTEANMNAIRIARATNGKNKIVYFTGAYHGTYDGFLGIPYYDEGAITSIPMAPGITENNVKDLVLLSYDKASSLRYIEQHADEISAVLVESVQSRKPELQPREFLHKLREVTADNDIALIFDEVITGFRIALGGAQEFFGVKADLVTYGKVLGGGMPIGVVTGTSKYMDCVDGGMWSYGDMSVPPVEDKRAYVAGTFCHHPMAMAAANAVLKYIEGHKGSMYKELNEKTEYLISSINEFFVKEGIPFKGVHFGSLFRIKVDKKYEIFYYGLLEKGIYIWEGRSAFLSTEHSYEDIEKIILAVKKTALEMKDSGFFNDNPDMPDQNRRAKSKDTDNKEGETDGDAYHLRDYSYDMSLIQHRLILQTMITGEDPYDMISASKVTGKIDVLKLENAIRKVIQRHETLRSSMDVRNNTFKQQVYATDNFKIRRIDGKSYHDINQMITENICKFNLASAPLVEVIIFEQGIDKAILVFHLHHMISDGYSMNIFAQEVLRSYNGEALPELQSQYRDYVKAEKEYLTSEQFLADQAFWKEYMNDAEGIIPLYYDGSAEPCEKAVDIISYRIPQDRFEAFKNTAKENRVTLFMALLSVFNILLHKMSLAEDISVLTPVSARYGENFNNNIGMFTNTIALRSLYKGVMTFGEYLRWVRDNEIKTFSHMNYPYNNLIQDLNMVGRQSFNTVFIYENEDGRTPEMSGLEIEKLDYIPQKQEFDFTVEIFERKGCLDILFEYKTDKFRESSIRSMLNHYIDIIDQVIANPSICLYNISTTNAIEKTLILNDFNHTFYDYDRSKTIQELFEEQARLNPDKIAVSFQEQYFTYSYMNKMANILAGRLRQEGILPNDYIAIMAERSPEMIIGLLAILKSGAAYVPLDADYPKNRIQYILEDCKPKVVLTYKCIVETKQSVIDLADITNWEGTDENPKVINRSDDLAYLIYTSGTSGTPKGVMVEHKGVVNLKYYFEENLGICSKDRILQFSNTVFDASVWEIFMALLTGAELVLISGDTIRDPEAFKHYTKEKQVTVATLPPNYYVLVAGLHLRVLITAGSEASNTLVKGILKGRYINAYGPTEATVCASHWECTDWNNLPNIIPIGRPINNTKIYILQEASLCAVGVPGELCITGDGLARGYLNRPELTEEKFVVNPFGAGKMYKTGDLARWLPDGNIEYLGRIDEQVKIRGFRIELGEIENQLRRIEAVKDCAVIARADQSGEKAIHAYIVSDNEISMSDIRDRLMKVLPEYMIPSYLMQLEKIPVTVSGKLDKRALPEIEAGSEKGYMAPKNETEKLICGIFSELTGVKKVGSNDDFFEIGGHSLRATKLINRIEAETGSTLSLKDIFQYKTPALIAEFIESSEKEEYKPIPYAKEKEYYPMSSTQKRTYLLCQIDGENLAYNMPVNLRLRGDIHLEAMKDAIQKMIDRHEILRTEFLVKDGELLQRIHDRVEADIEICENDTATDEELIAGFIRPFDLGTAKLVRAKLVNRGEYWLLMTDMHHIISDGMSQEIFINELTSLYNGETLPPLSKQYKDYSEWMRTNDLSAQKEFWVKEFRDEIPVLDMPLDYSRPQEQSFMGSAIRVETERKLCTDIKAFAKANDVTEYMVFLSAAMVLLSKYSRQEDIVIGSPISGRLHRDTEQMLGMFINTLAMRGRPEGSKTYAEFLMEMKEFCLKAYENQEYPFEELVEAVEVERNFSRNPLFDVLLVLQNNEGVKANLKDSSIEYLSQDTTTAKFDLSFDISENNGSYSIVIKYCTDLFRSETVERLAKRYMDLLLQLIDNKELKLCEVELISPEEKHQILKEFNDTQEEYPFDRTVMELFEEQVRKTPDHTAIEYEGSKLTYQELNARVNVLANRLRRLGVKPDDFVAILAERSPQLIESIYGVLKAGGAYVPIDIASPQDRIQNILKDCSPKAVLTYSCSLKTNLPVIDLTESGVWEGASENPVPVNKPSDLAYCIYTSGTTGRPKGVMIEHKSLTNHLSYARKHFFKDSYKIPLFTNYSFDLTVPILFGPLLIGATLEIFRQEESDSIGRVFGSQEITMAKMTPSHLKLALMQPDNAESRINTLIVGGELLTAQVAEGILDKFGRRIEIHNEYGPTEATVGCCEHVFDPEKDKGYAISIGKPMSNARIYIMNGDRLCGIGIPGELCIAGAGVARGYLNMPELTAEKFVKDPFGEGRMYKTGDLARWLPTGELDYLGRMDEQIKIRGFRIELGEIENQIRKLKDIKDCAVIARTDKSGDKAIHAYIVSEKEINITGLRDLLSEGLPEYMIPPYMLQIGSIPVTRNGKLDKRALPDIEVKSETEYVAPQNRTQELICNIFSDMVGVGKVGINDDFFKIGGHSLRAMRLVNWIESITGSSISLPDIFKYRTPAQIAAYIDHHTIENYEPIPKALEMEYYPMSSAQKRTFLLSQIEEQSLLYNMPMCLKLRGELRPDAMKEALQKMVDRHEILRTQFIAENGELFQKIHNRVEPDFELGESGAASDEEMIADFIRPFDLASARLVRAKLVNRGEYWLLMTDMHHIISDGMSQEIFIRELTSLYNGKELKTLTKQYKDYSEWMRTRDLSAQKAFWVNEYSDEIPVLNMPLDFGRPQIQSYRGAGITVETGSKLCRDIKAFAKTNDVTEYMLFLSAAMVLLSKYSCQEDIVIGSPISGRSHHDTEQMLGMFINTLAMRGKPAGHKSYLAFLKEIKQFCLEAYKNQEYPFEELVETVKIKRDLSRHPLFDVMLIMQNNETIEGRLKGNSDIELVKQESLVSKFDLTIEIREVKGSYNIAIEYCTDLFLKDTAKRMVEHFINVLNQLCVDKDMLINQIDLTSQQEKDLILKTFNATKVEYPSNKTIMELFEEQVKVKKNDVAVVFEDNKLTYEEFNNKANALAYKLRILGVGPDDFVAIIAERSLEMLCGIYGVLKAGGAYVPIDPANPKERVKYILKDCSPRAILTYDAVIETDLPVINLADHEVWEGSTDNLKSICKPENLAYCIYTSGTSGTPKGVMLKQCNVVNYCYRNRYNVMNHAIECGYSKIVSVTNYTFDIFVTEILLSLINGMTVYLTNSKEQNDVRALSDVIVQNDIEILQSTPSRINMMLSDINGRRVFEKLKYLLIGGEKLEAETVNRLSKITKAVLQNVYGPSETTVWSSSKVIDPENISANISIGRPISNTGIYIMNGSLLCAVGVPGELCITGDGLARGYLNRPELTEEKFVVNPFGAGKMYKTGDLARWLPDGNIEYLGRIDEQVKIRGFRIELGEIENQLRRIEAVKDCAVIARADQSGEKAIHAYIVSDNEISMSDIRDRLMKVLPEYMIPSYLMQLEKIPVTVSGKLDKRALPEIEAGSEKGYMAPKNETEKLICGIFSELTGVKKVGSNDDFFEIGGHSLRATKLINRIEAETGSTLSLKDIFQYKTPALIAEFIESSEKEEYKPIPYAKEKEYYPMSSTQKRTYLLCQIDGENLAYNMPVNLRLRGDIHLEAMKDAIQKMIDRHEILRTEFLVKDGELLQRIHDRVEADIEICENDTATDEELIAGFIRPFDLGTAKLVRAKLVNRGEYWLLMTDMHHIISDGMSQEIFINELTSLYNGETLPPLSKQYKDYSEWMRTNDLSAQKEFWVKEFRDEIPVLDMPLDYSRPQEQSFMGSAIRVETERKLCTDIKAFAKANDVTEYMVFLSAAMVLLSKYSRQEDIVIGSPISGRLHRDTEQMLGMFINTLAMRGRPEGSKTYAEFLMEMKEFCLKAYENQEYPFEELVEAVEVERNFSRNPLFDVLLVLQNNEGVKANLKDSSIEYLSQDTTTAKFDLSFDISENNGSYSIVIKYCTDLFRSETVERLAKRYMDLLLQLIDNKELKLCEVELISPEEKHQILKEFNDTQEEYPFDRTVMELFEEQVRKTPDHTAIEYEGSKLTYQELNARVNVLANRLRRLGVKPDDFVAILAERSPQLIESIYGVLKAGGAYVPIDIASPQDRIQNILKDCSPKAVLTYSCSLKTNLPVIDLTESGVWEGASENPVPVNKPSDLAYCIYTSGTTGRPKGVMIEHKSLTNHLSYARKHFFKDSYKIPLFTNYSFDLTVPILFGPLLIGATLEIFRQEESDSIGRVFGSQEITMAKMTPSHLKLALMQPDNAESRINTLIVGGELLTAQVAEGILDKFGRRIEIHNEYGPTEATVGCCEHVFDPEKDKGYAISIGKPMSNARIYIMNGDRLCGIGIPGELCIAGAGVARGYLNMPELTAEKFVKDPFGEGRMYKTGDLARWLPTGELDYLGRMDEQIKIRGFRIELGEIENQIRKLKDIKDCAVIARTDKSGDKAIHAYIVSEKEISLSGLRDLLSEGLPEYMIPPYMLQIESIPVTRNGKLDKHALPDIEVKSETEYVAPRNEKEQAVCDVFSTILGVDKVSVVDNFFTLGGDSIKAIRMLSPLRMKGYEIEINDILTLKSPEAISRKLKSADPLISYSQDQYVGEVALSPIQKRFFQMGYKNVNHYNQSHIMKFRETIDIDAMRAAFDTILEHHDILRSKYPNHVQSVVPFQKGSNYELIYKDISKEKDIIQTAGRISDEIEESIDIEKGPIVKACIIRTEKEDHMLICIHHLVIDIYSWKILLQDLIGNYMRILHGAAIELQPKTASYKDWVEALKEYSKTYSLKNELGYWEKVSQRAAAAKLRKDFAENRLNKSELQIRLNNETTDKLIHEVNHAYGTETKDILLCALGLAVKKWSGQDNIAIALEGHGREKLPKKINIDRTIGWFTAIYPVVITISDDLGTSIIDTKEMVRRIPNHGIGYGVLKYLSNYSEHLPEVRPDICFNYAGVVDSEIRSMEDYTISELPSGNTVSAANDANYVITINAGIIDGKLGFDVLFACNFEDGEKESFKKAFHSAIDEIVIHCANKNIITRTASDYGAAEMNSSDLSYLSDLLRSI